MSAVHDLFISRENTVKRNVHSIQLTSSTVGLATCLCNPKSEWLATPLMRMINKKEAEQWV
jgi:hypothetical protein